MSFDRIKGIMPIFILLLMLSSMAFICSDDQKDNSGSKIYLFNAGTTDGDLGGRSGADGTCQGHANRPAACTHACFAFISSDTDNEIRDLQKNPYDMPDGKFYGPDGAVKIADSWADLLDGSIDVSLANAGVLPGGSEFWSGTLGDFSINTSFNCNSWSSNNAGDNGCFGSADFPSNWINAESDTCASLLTYYLLCICY